MKPPEPTDDRHPVDDLVREHVEREVAAVDAAAMLARVRSAQQAEPARTPLWKWAAAVGVGMAIGATAAALFLVNLGTPQLPGERPTEAQAAPPTPTELVRAALVVHSDDSDRRYDVKVERGDLAALARRFPNLALPQQQGLVRDSTLWVRGNQFWVNPGPDARPIAWGRDRDGRVWAALNPRQGVQFAREEDGEPLALLCDLMSLRIPTLAAEMLEGYDLYRDGTTTSPDEPIRLAAIVRTPGREFASPRVWLELDPKTKVIRKAIQRRTIGGEVVGTFTYTLMETGRLPDEKYDLRGHLELGARVWDAKDKPARSEVFNRWPWWKK